METMGLSPLPELVDIDSMNKTTKEIMKLTKPEKVAIYAITLNTVLTFLKFVLAFVTGSLALKAEAYHSFSDIWSSIMVFVSIRYGEEHKDKQKQGFIKGLWLHPQRMAALYIGIFLLIVSVSIFLNAFKIESPDIRYQVPVALVVLMFALGSWFLTKFEHIVGEKTGSTALVADAYHSRVDMVGSVVVAVALLGEGFGLRLDRIGAGVLSLFIFFQAINVFATIIKDYAQKDLGKSNLVPTWGETLSRSIFPKWESACYAFLIKKFGFDLKDKNSRIKVNRKLAYSALIILFAGWILSGAFVVNANQQAIVERFGKPIQTDNTLGPGLHYMMPYPIDRLRRYDCLKVRRIMVGSEVSPDSEMLLWTNIHYIREHNVLTGENTLADIGMAVHYRISNLHNFLYSSNRPERIFEEISYSVLLESMAERDLFISITVDRDTWESELTNMILSKLASLEIGLEIVDLNLRDMHPPMNVAGDFEDVVSAEIDYEMYINEAIGYRNNLLPIARGTATRTVTAAKAGKDAVVRQAEGETCRFNSNYNEYVKSRQVYKTRLLIETLEKYLPGIKKYILPREAVDSDVEMWMFNTGSMTGSRLGE